MCQVLPVNPCNDNPSVIKCIRESHGSHEDPHIPPANVPSTAQGLQPWRGHDRPNMAKRVDIGTPKHIAPFGSFRPNPSSKPSPSSQWFQRMRIEFETLTSRDKQSCCTHLCQGLLFISQWSPCQNPRSAAQMGSCSPRIPRNVDRAWHGKIKHSRNHCNPDSSRGHRDSNNLCWKSLSSTCLQVPARMIVIA